MPGDIKAAEWWSIIARKKLGKGADWRWCKLEAIGPDTLVEGGVPRILKRGPRKGKASWRGIETERCMVSRVELADEMRLYGQRTGECPHCEAGKTLFRHSRAEGTEYMDCKRCKGTGKYQPPACGTLGST